MNVIIDLGAALRNARELPDELAALTEVEPALRDYYSEKGGRIVIDADRRAALVSHLSDIVERGTLAADNAKLRDQQNRRQVVEVVRGHLSKSVKPDLLDAAVVTFMSQHKFGIRNGEVIVVGKHGRSDAEMAAVNWIDDEGAAFSPGAQGDQSVPGGFGAQVARIRDKN